VSAPTQLLDDRVGDRPFVVCADHDLHLVL
jgi:hypothetical protein